jgi:hypothetical protein
MKYIKYILWAILIFQSQSKGTNEDEFCEDYGMHDQIQDLNECFTKKVSPHHICCGLKIIYSDQLSLISCKNLPASKISIDLFKEHLIEEFNSAFEFICPEKEEEKEINGTCSEFRGFAVEDGDVCLSLTEEKDKTCCSLQYKMDEKIEEFPFPPNYTECISLPNVKSKMDEKIENMKKRYNFTGLELAIKCGNVINKSSIINFNIHSFISLLIIYLLFI